MTFKPVGADENGKFPTRIEKRLPIVVNVLGHGITSTSGDNSAAWAALLATATTLAPLDIYFPSGSYAFDSPWPTIDPEKVRVRGAGANHTIIDFTALASGPAVPIAKATGSNRQTVPLADLRLAGPTSGATTVDCISLGTSSLYANQTIYERLHIDDFRDQIVSNNNTWNTEIVNCSLRNAHRYGYNITGNPANSGEGLRMIGGAIFGATTDCIRHMFGGELECIDVSFDYSNHLATLGGGSRLNFTSCHFECGDAQTGTELLTLDKASGLNSHLSLKNCTFLPTYTTAGTIRAFIRIIGTTGTNNDQSVIQLDALEIVANSTQATVNALIIDASTASTAAAANSESNIFISGVSYRDAGGSVGNYYPWYVQDRANRKHFISGGVNYGNLLYDYAHRASAWSFPAIHTQETVPHKLAVDTLQLVSGDLYVVRLPITAGVSWVGSATELAVAIAAAGASLTAQAIGLYDLGNESVAAPTTLTRVANMAGMTFTANPNTVHTASPGAFNMLYPRHRYFAAICVVGTTGPNVYGLKAAAQSPLLDPQSTRFPLDAGKLTGQTGLPSTITISNLLKSDFMPWFSFRPTAY